MTVDDGASVESDPYEAGVGASTAVDDRHATVVDTPCSNGDEINAMLAPTRWEIVLRGFDEVLASGPVIVTSMLLAGAGGISGRFAPKIAGLGLLATTTWGRAVRDTARVARAVAVVAAATALAAIELFGWTAAMMLMMDGDA